MIRSSPHMKREQHSIPRSCCIGWWSCYWFCFYCTFQNLGKRRVWGEHQPLAKILQRLKQHSKTLLINTTNIVWLTDRPTDRPTDRTLLRNAPETPPGPPRSRWAWGATWGTGPSAARPRAAGTGAGCVCASGCRPSCCPTWRSSPWRPARRCPHCPRRFRRWFGAGRCRPAWCPVRRASSGRTRLLRTSCPGCWWTGTARSGFAGPDGKQSKRSRWCKGQTATRHRVRCVRPTQVPCVPQAWVLERFAVEIVWYIITTIISVKVIVVVILTTTSIVVDTTIIVLIMITIIITIVITTISIIIVIITTIVVVIIIITVITIAITVNVVIIIIIVIVIIIIIITIIICGDGSVSITANAAQQKTCLLQISQQNRAFRLWQAWQLICWERNCDLEGTQTDRDEDEHKVASEDTMATISSRTPTQCTSNGTCRKILSKLPSLRVDTPTAEGGSSGCIYTKAKNYLEFSNKQSINYWYWNTEESCHLKHVNLCKDDERSSQHRPFKSLAHISQKIWKSFVDKLFRHWEAGFLCWHKKTVESHVLHKQANMTMCNAINYTEHILHLYTGIIPVFECIYTLIVFISFIISQTHPIYTILCILYKVHLAQSTN